MTLHSGANLWRKGIEWSERLDSNQRPLSPQNSGHQNIKRLPAEIGTDGPGSFGIGSGHFGAKKGGAA